MMAEVIKGPGALWYLKVAGIIMAAEGAVCHDNGLLDLYNFSLNAWNETLLRCAAEKINAAEIQQKQRPL